MLFQRFRDALLLAMFFLAVQPVLAQISINEVLAENKNIVSPDGSVTDWVELYNNGSQAASLAGYSLTDAVATPRKWIFPANTSIPAKGFLLVLLDSSRPASTSSGALLNAGFGIKGSGDRIELYSPSSLLVESVRFGPQAADYSLGRAVAGAGNHVLCTPTPGSANIAQSLGVPGDLRVNEWLASPATGKDWLELYNPGTLPVQLTGLYFTDDGNVPSPIAPLSYIGTDRYGYVRFYADNSTNDNEVTFKLSGSGDSVSLFAGNGTLIDSVRFGQQTADVSEGRLPDGSTTKKSLNVQTPGESNLILYPGLVVNELLSHTDPPLDDAVEFYNQTALPIDISGWYLSNSRNDLKKYRVPSGTIVKAKGYAVIYESKFNVPPNAFTFNSAHGDQVYLSQANASGDLTGYIVSETFEASENGVSFGRYETSVAGDYKFVATAERSFGGALIPGSVAEFETGPGASNSPPKVGPIVINEVMYNPPSTAADGADNLVDEYVELRNIAAQPVALYDPLNPVNHWRLQGAIGFTFPAGASLPALGYALAVSFDPAANVTQLSAFRAKYAVPATVQIFGPYTGKLGNAGDAVELYKPDPPQLPPHPDAGFVPYIRVDKVNYRDVAPWPTEADGTGKSLQRKNSSQFGNDPINWQAAAPSAGRGSSSEVVDSDGDGLPDAWETLFGFDRQNPADGGVDTDGDGLTNLEEYIAATDPRSAASSLKITSLVPDAVNGPVLVFTSVTGQSYSIQSRNSLLPSTVWQTLISTNATGNEMAIRDDSAAARDRRFYRVVTPALR